MKKVMVVAFASAGLLAAVRRWRARPRSRSE